jgi:hypothetical protein
LKILFPKKRQKSNCPIAGSFVSLIVMAGGNDNFIFAVKEKRKADSMGCAPSQENTKFFLT